MNEWNQARTGPEITSAPRHWTLEWELESLVATLPPAHTTTHLTKNNTLKNTVMESIIALYTFSCSFTDHLIGTQLAWSFPWPGPGCVSRIFSLKIDINGHFD